ncbi:hypothetical protein ACLBWJ_14455 [Microbacterium sp. M4A5_1d]
MSARRSIRSSVAVLAAWVCAVALLVAAPVALSSSIAPAPAAAAASGADFNPGNIISDAAFYDSNAMGSPEIQAFMERQVRSCSSGYTCLKDYRQNTDTRPADRYCNGYEGRGNESASTIIDRVARSCGISQKVILVLLQKEQSLVTSTAPSARDYAAATGQGCPDTAPCDSATLGFFYQVYYAARQYKIYKAFPRDFGYQAGRWNNILYHPYNNCGTQRVYIENQATAGLYIYTPYVPNQAALNNMYGEGDTCSSYGNRNFWRLYTDWFGSTESDLAHRPVGSLDVVEVSPGQFRVAGWAADPDTADSIDVHVYIGGAGYAVRADRSRPDVGAAFPGLGAARGFDRTFPASAEGELQVCAWAINVGPGANTLLGCRSMTAMAGSPIVTIDSTQLTVSSMTIAGWAIDPDTTEPVSLHVYVDGVGRISSANRNRADLAPHYPAYGTRHGFSETIALTPGDHSVCIYAINVGVGDNRTVTCSTVRVPGGPDQGREPIGALDVVSVSGQTVTAAGWAIDPDTATAIPVHIYFGANGVATQADRRRSDIGAAFPLYGAGHGFSASAPLTANRLDVCAYAINTAGPNRLLGCKTVESALAPQALGRSPIGSLDVVSVSPDGRSLRVAGWAIDPDTAGPTAIHAYLDGVGAISETNRDRPDVAASYPAYGVRRGYDVSMPLRTGSRSVCVYAVDDTGRSNTLLGCRAIP